VAAPWSRRPHCGEMAGAHLVPCGASPGCSFLRVCIICVEFEQGRMTAKEARRALGEMVPKVGAQHAEKVERTLREAEERATATAATSRSPHSP